MQVDPTTILYLNFAIGAVGWLAHTLTSRRLRRIDPNLWKKVGAPVGFRRTLEPSSSGFEFVRCVWSRGRVRTDDHLLEILLLILRGVHLLAIVGVVALFAAALRGIE